MTSPSRKEIGAFVEGTVKKTEAVGKLFQLDVQISGKPTVADDSPVSILGTIIAEPAKNVVGYDGDAPTAVWGAVVAPAGR